MTALMIALVQFNVKRLHIIRTALVNQSLVHSTLNADVDRTKNERTSYNSSVPSGHCVAGLRRERSHEYPLRLPRFDGQEHVGLERRGTGKNQTRRIVGDPHGAGSRKSNIQHHLVYQVIKD